MQTYRNTDNTMRAVSTQQAWREWVGRFDLKARADACADLCFSLSLFFRSFVLLFALFFCLFLLSRFSFFRSAAAAALHCIVFSSMRSKRCGRRLESRETSASLSIVARAGVRVKRSCMHITSDGTRWRFTTEVRKMQQEEQQTCR